MVNAAFPPAKNPGEGSPERAALIPEGGPGYLDALAVFIARFGMDPRVVLSTDSWAVTLIDGEPEVILYRSGVRALGLMSPLRNGQEIAEQIIAAGGTEQSK